MNAVHPSVSVVIPCYNGVKYLRETIDSVLVQTCPVHEIILVDDGSTDDSAAIAESYGPPVRVIRQPNQGESVARNRGIDEAQGNWVAFLDADDLWKPEKIERQLSRITPNVSAICTANENLWPAGAAVPVTWFHPRPESFRRAWVLEFGAPCHISSLLVRRELAVRFPSWTQYAEDLVYFLDLLEEGRTIEVVDAPLMSYRFHGNNQTSKPEIGIQREKTLQTWLQQHRGHLRSEEAAELEIAMCRRNKYWLMSQAITDRRFGSSGRGFVKYLRVLASSLISSSSRDIVKTAFKGAAGAILEVSRLKKYTY
ncbi:glycosyltransferase [bacterium]|nr:glycosyltransferase [bacterium]